MLTYSQWHRATLRHSRLSCRIVRMPGNTAALYPVVDVDEQTAVHLARRTLAIWLVSAEPVIAK